MSAILAALSAVYLVWGFRPTLKCYAYAWVLQGERAQYRTPRERAYRQKVVVGAAAGIVLYGGALAGLVQYWL